MQMKILVMGVPVWHHTAEERKKRQEGETSSVAENEAFEANWIEPIAKNREKTCWLVVI